MNSGLYTAKITCPICEESFDVVKLRASVSKLENVDEDFCLHYSGINPLLYEPWICEHCGYAGFSANFEVLTDMEKELLRKFCLNKFTQEPDKNPFELKEFHQKVYQYFDSLDSEKERDNFKAIAAFEILVHVLKARNAPNSLKAKTLLRIGWIYRFMNNPMEMEYLKEAVDCFSAAYKEENFPVGKFDIATCAFLIGELSRRIGNLKQAMEWLGRTLAQPPSPETSKIIEKAREQIQAIKSSPEYAKIK